ncbi:hypothetical protein HDV01_006560 [Terramyces sp. JEL0728]|nr:hypothetical protein HDV01_006560 [Terramyces sp. JEL0728]
MIPTLTILDTNSANDKLTHPSNTSTNPYLAPPDDFNGIFITCNLTGLDSANDVFHARFNLFPVGNLAANGVKDSIFRRPVSAVTVVIGSNAINFAKSVPMSTQSINLGVSSGNINRYPFDSFTTDFVLYAQNTNDSTPIPIAFGIVGAIQSWRSDIQVLNGTDSGIDLITVNVVSKRSFTTQFFSIFIVLSMWILSLTIFTLATTLWFRERKVEPPTIAVTASLLFALPAIRNTQPGIPSIGATIDLAGFMWNMFLVLVSCCVLMANYIHKYQRDKPQYSKA